MTYELPGQCIRVTPTILLILFLTIILSELELEEGLASLDSFISQKCFPFSTTYASIPSQPFKINNWHLHLYPVCISQGDELKMPRSKMFDLKNVFTTLRTTEPGYPGTKVPTIHVNKNGTTSKWQCNIVRA